MTDRTHATVQVGQPAWERHGEVLRAEFPSLTWLVVHEDGLRTIEPDGTPSSTARDDASADVAWTDLTLFRSAAARPFFGLVLNSDPAPTWVHSSAAGLDDDVWQRLIARGSVLTGSHLSGVPISEYVLAQVLSWFQEPAGFDAARADQKWDSSPFREIHGSTWVVVGLGAIGDRVAALATAFGAHVIGVRRRPNGDEPWPTHPLSELNDLVPAADVIVLAVPASTETDGMIDAALLDRCKDDAVLVNVGRGSLVDEAALIAALDAGTFGAALLDVTETEPLPAGHPFWTHDRVRLTPHGSAMSTARFDRCRDQFVSNLHLWLAGEPLPHQA